MTEKEIVIDVRIDARTFAKLNWSLGRKALWLTVPMFIALAALDSGWPASPGAWLDMAILAAAFAACMTIVYPISNVLSRVIFRNQPNLRVPMRFTFSETGVIGESPLERVERRWACFISFHDRGALYFLKLSPLFGLMIPKAAFPSAEVEERFRSLARGALDQGGAGRASRGGRRMTEKPIQIEVTLDEDAFVRFQEEHAARQRWIVGALFVVFFGVVTVTQRDAQMPLWISLVTFALLLGAVGLAMVLPNPVLRYRHRRVYRAQPSLQVALRYTLSEAGLAAESAMGKGESRWAAFIELRELKSFFFLKFGPNIGYPIPKSSFATPADEEHFRSFVTRSVEAARAARAAAGKP